jgi:hypothetical protein
MVAYASMTMAGLIGQQNGPVIDQLLRSDSVSGFTQVSALQIGAWRQQLDILREVSRSFVKRFPELNAAPIILEYRIPRRDKRIDAVLLMRDTVVILEFKVGAEKVSLEDRSQVLDYALDIAYYHHESANRRIVPLLCPTQFDGFERANTGACGVIDDLIVCGAASLLDTLVTITKEENPSNLALIDGQAWEKSRYQPVPGIIEASVKLFSQHTISDINKSLASIGSIDCAINFTHQAIRHAQQKGEKILCLLTGVPGAGKTLTGLRLAHLEATLETDWRAVFMSGNGPLLRVLRAALTTDYAETQGIPKAQAKLHAEASIHSVHTYLNETGRHPNAPAEQIVIFDEAQRAWDAKKMAKMAGKAREKGIASDTSGANETQKSEPWQLLSVLDRHVGGAVLVALCGNGQEIHDGEAGVAEWIAARDASFNHWRILCSSTAAILSHIGDDHPRTEIVQEMHLGVPLRSHRAMKHALWVDAVLEGNSSTALSHIDQGNFPILMTSNLDSARDWLYKTTLGTRRCGLLASSSGTRLRPYGIEVAADFRKSIDFPKWFTGPKGDIRSSYALEVAATEFGCQGLELDRVCVAWSWDLLATPSIRPRSFRGSRWMNISGLREREYALNKYRVLLTRAREGMVIWVPNGRDEDSTRDPGEMDELRRYLRACGVVEI